LHQVDLRVCVGISHRAATARKSGNEYSAACNVVHDTTSQHAKGVQHWPSLIR